MGYKLWASTNGAPILVCTDAPPTSDIKDRDDSKYKGRVDFDWNYAVRFKLLSELVTFMRGLPNKCSRLAIMAHGWDGLIDIESVNPSAALSTQAQSDQLLKDGALTVPNIAKFKANLSLINDFLEPNSYLLFMACKMASHTAGAELLMEISKIVTNANIVGYTRIGTAYQVKSVKSCDYPGMKVGDYAGPATDDADLFKRKEALLSAPFADENNLYAKVARGGKLIKDPEPEYAPGVSLAGTHWVERLIGSWSLEIGDWKGVVVFEGSVAAGSGKSNWREAPGAFQHKGNWTRVGQTTEITFQFDTDQPGWKRLFRVKVDAASNNGDITIDKVPHGFFKLVDDLRSD
ncbi:hypothetical protein JQ615_28710 [Bradyrhizobium jicamae]|uniref:DUF4347 domain-containing protein n=1 Tax=Bradyrhizobium jicamae TaxID=280332 RepID=A0ABS5FRY0_9BRAD|nr:hypothetical protein [Bradyrhizobium jicamae]MBR0799374.1 hypothetical protein [Bradyrhizobium jicamae]MBR0936594.1 hypothetical protein [Bradyrhizobium jicamae]